MTTSTPTPTATGPAILRAYRLEVRADYPATKGIPADIAAEAVTEADEHDVEVTRVHASRFRGTDLVVVSLTILAPGDEAAIGYRDALPSAVRWASAEADRLRTGTGRSWRHLR